MKIVGEIFNVETIAEGRGQEMVMKFVVYMGQGSLEDFSADDLTIGRVYEVLEEADAHGMLRIIDDSDEDYLYPGALFEPVDIPAKTAERLHNVFAAQ